MCTDARGRLHECPRPVSQMPEAGCTNARGQYHKCLRPVARMPEAGITLSPGRYHVAFGPVSWPRLDHAGPGGMAVQFRCSRFSIFISVCGFLRYADTRKTICNNPKNDFRKEKKKQNGIVLKNIYLATKIFSSHEWQQQMVQSIHFIAFCNV